MKLTICMITYNHALYISQAIESIISQETNFKYELVIADDCSTDTTRDICIEYKKKYPEKIRLVLPEKNLGMMQNFINTLSFCKGKYIALCEGDDYWTDPSKLQKQVDFLEANPDFAICFHNMQIIYEGVEGENRISNPMQKEVTTIYDLANGNYIYTASCVFRNGLIPQLPDWFAKSPVGDYPLHLLNAQYGKIKFFKEVMGVYRINPTSIWGGKNNLYVYSKWRELLSFLENYFDAEVNKVLKEQKKKCLIAILDILLRRKDFATFNKYLKTNNFNLFQFTFAYSKFLIHKKWKQYIGRR